jgi:cell division protein ZapA (FtsZ GTPase activity inhibitor)
MTSKKTAPERIDVEIFGSTYTLRGSDPDAIRAVAQRVDSQMRDLASPGADPLKVAILAALQFADEARDKENQAISMESEAAERIEALASRIENAIRPPAETSPPQDGRDTALDGARPVG